MDQLSPVERTIAADVFRYLVTPSGTKIAYTSTDLVAYISTPGVPLTPVLEKLAGSGLRILRTVDPPADQPRETRYEIFHDVLAAAILDWRARYMQEKQKREFEYRLAEEARAEQRRAEEERRQKELADARKLAEVEAQASRRLRRLTAALVVVSIFAIIAAGLALRNSADADAQRKVAEQKSVEANQQRQAADAQRKVAERKSIEADQQRQAAEANAEAARMYQADYQVTLLKRLNDIRATNGLPPLDLNDDLSRVAQAHSKYMAENGITHLGADGSRVSERLTEAGYGAGHPGEVIYGGDVTVDDAWTFWTTDPAHLQTLLDPVNTVVGIGIYKQGDLTYYTYDFGKPAP
jgi:uncharacterized protein YkwD